MELLANESSDRALSVIPLAYSNVARFFNGINNSNPSSKKKV
jgi:hypothetical protein